jgi:hypothetical protein
MIGESVCAIGDLARSKSGAQTTQKNLGLDVDTSLPVG